MNPPVVVRLPIAVRVYIAVLGVVWCSGFAVGLVEVLFIDGQLVGLLLLLMLAFGGTVMFRSFRMSVEASGDVLVVRNMYGTRSLDRRQINAFTVGTPPFQFVGKVVFVTLGDHSLVSLDATLRPALFAGGRQVLAERVSALEAWRSSDS